MNHEVDYADWTARLPNGVQPAHDGLVIEMPRTGKSVARSSATESVRLTPSGTASAAIAREARPDGKLVLNTSTELPGAEVTLAYKSLWRMERAFRNLKSAPDVRPGGNSPRRATRASIEAAILS